MGYLILLVGGWALYKLNDKYHWVKVGQQAAVINLDKALPVSDAGQVTYLLQNVQDPHILRAASESYKAYPIASSLLAQKAVGH